METLMMHCTSLHEGDCGNTDDDDTSCAKMSCVAFQGSLFFLFLASYV